MEQSDALKQFRLALTALVALAVLGTAGYHILMGWNLLDSLYMTVITLGTVGYKEVGKLDDTGKIFTITLIVFGIMIVFWAGASLVEAVVGEQIWHAIQRRRMQKHIARLRDHYIICGFGRMGQQIVKDLSRAGVPHCVIERNPEQLPKLISQDIPFVEGNASDDKVLRAAGIERAKGLITVAPSDEDNVFITLSAKNINPDLFVVARSILEENEDKLRKAGANRVMSPYAMGGRRMALAVTKPNVLDFVELAMRTEDARIAIEELEIGPISNLVGCTVGSCGLKKESGVSVIAIKRSTGELVANPSADQVLGIGDVLIVLGPPEKLTEAERLTHSS